MTIAYLGHKEIEELRSLFVRGVWIAEEVAKQLSTPEVSS